jgi:5-methyltetrahydrofolate--homocysteine methyltransferase
MNALIRRLGFGRPLVMDAATGTALLERGLDPLTAVETNPAVVAALHAEHVAAGAEVVLTATFQARRFEACRRGVEVARLARPRYVLGSVGPCRREEIAEIVAGLEGADGMLLETFSSPEALELAAYAHHRLPETESVPVLLSLAYLRRDGELVTLSGHAPETYARHAARHGVAALGVNCGKDVTPDDCAEILRRYRSECDLPLFARPNAGSPGGGVISPQRLAGADWSNAAMVGGCCGTTAAHVEALRAAFGPGYDEAGRDKR